MKPEGEFFEYGECGNNPRPDAYFAKPGANGNWILMHGVGRKPGRSEIDIPLDYGDCYFLEALLRFRKWRR